jgi:hypothetical protein
MAESPQPRRRSASYGILPVDPSEPCEVAIGRTQCSAVLDRQRGKRRIHHEALARSAS